MKLKLLNCPNCNRQTIQGKGKVPNWKHGVEASRQSVCTSEVTVCSVCGYYIQRKKVWQEKCFYPQDYNLD